jgi:hypothetical protein
MPTVFPGIEENGGQIIIFWHFYPQLPPHAHPTKSG